MRTKRLLAVALMIAMLLFSLQTAVGEDVIADLASDVVAADENVLEAAAEEEADANDEDLALDNEVISEAEASEDLTEEDALEVAPEEDIVAVAEEEERPVDAAEDIEEVEETDLFAVLEDGQELAEILEDEPEEPEVAEYSQGELGTLESIAITTADGTAIDNVHPLVMTEGTKVQLNVNTTPAGSQVQSFVWSYEKADIATVDEKGVVTAMDVEAKSQTTITVAAYLDGTPNEPAKSVTIPVIVIPVTSRIALFDHKTDPGHANELANDALSSIVDKAMVVDYVCEPSDEDVGLVQSVTAVSSNPSILSVTVYAEEDDHSLLLTPLDTGTVTLTLTSADKKVERELTINVTKNNGNNDLTLVVPSKLQIVKGKKVTLKPQIAPAGSYKSVAYTYTTSNAKVAKRSKTKGASTVITGVKVGSATVTVTATVTNLDGSKKVLNGKISVKVAAKPSLTWSSLTVKPTTKTLIAGSGTATLTGTFKAKIANTDTPVTWTSNKPKVATVQNGKVSNNKVTAIVTPISAGTVKITGTTNDGTNKKKTVTLTVYNQPTDLKISAPNAIVKGSPILLTAIPVDKDGKADAKAKTENTEWKIVEGDSYATIDAAGHLTVNAIPAEGERIVVRATDGNNPKAEDELVVTADDVSGQNAQDVLIMGSDNSPLTSMNVTLTNDEPMILNWTAQVMPSDANQTLAWKSDNTKVATVETDDEGKAVVKVLAAGKANITATTVDGSGVSKGVVLNVAKDIQNWDVPKTIEVALKKSVTIVPTTTPAGALTTGFTYSYADKASKTYITLEKKNNKFTGKVIGKAAGRGTVTVKGPDGKTEKVTVVVKAKAATKVSIKADQAAPIEPVAGKTLKLTATLTPKGCSQLVTWTSANPAIATVDEKGLVTLKEGVTAPNSVKITAKATDGSNKSAAYTVKIGYPPQNVVAHAVGSGNKVYVVVSKTTAAGSLYADVTRNDELPLYSNKVTWSLVASNNKANTYATINASTGRIKGKKANGSVKLYAVATAADGSGVSSAKIPVVVTAKTTASTSVTIATQDFVPTNKKVTLFRGQQFDGKEYAKLIATVKKNTKAGVVWTTSKKDVVTVEPDGRIKPVGAGTAVITATAADGTGQNDILTITVIEPADHIVLTGPNAVAKGATIKLTATVFDAQGNVIEGSPLSWEVDEASKEFIEFTADGTVKGLKATGENLAKLTATASYAPAKVPSDPYYVRVTDDTNADLKLSIYLDGKDVTYIESSEEDAPEPVVIRRNTNRKPQNKFQLNAHIEPDHANAAVTWEIDGPAVASVDKNNGVVTPLKEGTTFIVAKLNGDATVTARVKLDVNDKLPKVSLSSDWAYEFLPNGKSVNLTASVENIDEAEVEWKIEGDDETALVSEGNTAKLTPNIGTGEITVTVSLKDYDAKDSFTIDVTKPIAEGALNLGEPGEGDTHIKTDDSGNPYVELSTNNGGETYTIPLAGDPNVDRTQLKWTAEPENAISIDEEGNVTVKLASGTADATITIDPQDGSEPSVIPVKVVTKVDSITLTVPEGGDWWYNKKEAQKVTVAFEPADATDQSITWTFSNEEYVEITSDNSIKLKKLPADSVEIEITAQPSNGAAVTKTLTITSDFEIKISENSGAITNYAGTPDNGAVTIPEYVNSVPVKAITNNGLTGDALKGAFEGNKDITKIYIPDSIEKIGANAFKNCTKLATMSATTPVA